MAPLFMYGSGYLRGVSVIITAGLILISCCPAGAISNAYCYLMRGNVSLSVSLTTISNIVALVATPMSLSAARGIIGSQSSGLPLIPVIPMLRELGLMMLVPLVIGTIIRARIPKWVLAHRRFLRKVALVLVIALLVLIIGTGPNEVVGYIQEIALATVLFTTVLLALGWLMSLAFRLSAADRWGVLFEFPCRNLPIAAVVGITVLNRPELVRFAAAFFLIQTVIFLAMMTAVSKQRIPKKEF
jgi:BASS family bile acid:Na+ symporter